MSGPGPSAKFLAPAKKRLVIGGLQTRFSHLEFFAFCPRADFDCASQHERMCSSRGHNPWKRAVREIDPTQVRQRLRELSDASLRQGIVFVERPVHADAPDAVALLRR